jgi:hypothetical protein
MINRLLTIAVVAALALTACTETASETSKDVADARQDAVESNDEARAEASREVAKANERMDSAQQNQSEKDSDADRKLAGIEADGMAARARADYDIAMTAAEGRHQVSKEKCDAYEGAAANACIATADATLAADRSLAASNRDAAILAAENAK